LFVVENDLLIHEMQLGNKLSACVHEQRRQDFSLMLALLADDVREHSQFHLPSSMADVRLVDDKLLRQRFQLPEQAPLAIAADDDYQRMAQAQLTQDTNLSDIKLMQALRPMPLAEFDDAKLIRPEVLGNTSKYCQRKYRQQSDNDLVEPMSMDVGLLLDTIKASAIEAKIAQLNPVMA
jgi:hypothetical protein